MGVLDNYHVAGDIFELEKQGSGVQLKHLFSCDVGVSCLGGDDEPAFCVDIFCF